MRATPVVKPDRALTWRRIRAALTRAGGFTRCFHCGIPYGSGDRRSHLITYQRPEGHGGVSRQLTLTCEWCWPRISYEQRIDYLAHLLVKVWSPWPAPFTKPPYELDRIWDTVTELLAQEAGLPGPCGCGPLKRTEAS